MPMIVGRREKTDWNDVEELVLGSGRSHARTWGGMSDTAYTIFVLEGRLLSPPSAESQRLLEHTTIVGAVESKTVFRRQASQITAYDTVLAARVEGMEKMLAHLLTLEAPDGSREKALQESMLRLGWKPQNMIDARRISPPVFVAEYARLTVEIRTALEATEALRELPWALTLRGIRQMTYI